MIRLARPEEADAIRQLSAEAYVPAYMPLFGRAPMLAREDYAPRIARGEVWVMQVDEQLDGAFRPRNCCGKKLVLPVCALT